MEQVCDDLLETADKQIDKIKQVGNTKPNTVLAVDGTSQRRMHTENALKKPQHAWIRDIDNSYNVFVPSLTKKEHFKGASGALSAAITAT